MCFYGLHIFSNAQPSIRMRNHKTNWQRAPSENKKKKSKMGL